MYISQKKNYVDITAEQLLVFFCSEGECSHIFSELLWAKVLAIFLDSQTNALK